MERAAAIGTPIASVHVENAWWVPLQAVYALPPFNSQDDKGFAHLPHLRTARTAAEGSLSALHS